MIRLPLIITEAEKPKRKSRSDLIGFICLVLSVLFWIFALLPLLEQQ